MSRFMHPADASAINFIQSGAYSDARTIQAKQGEWLSVTDSGGVRTALAGSSDASGAPNEMFQYTSVLAAYAGRIQFCDGVHPVADGYVITLSGGYEIAQ